MLTTMAAMRSNGIAARRLSRSHGKALIVAALAALAGIVACARPPAAPASVRHLVLVTIDTLRADRVGVYSGVDLTPRLDRVARSGAYAVDAMAHVPLTRPSHATMFSGLLPWEAGVRDNLAPVELPDSPLLAEILKGAGFDTAAFVSSMVLERRGGFGRGFDRYDDDFPRTGNADLLSTLQKPGARTLAAATGWLEEHRSGERIFLWLHLFEPHDPYEPPEPYAARYADRPYDGEVAYVDSLIGQLDDALVRLGLAPETLLVVASDHGEGLGDHQETLHGFFVYQTTLAVPLIFRGPGIVGGGRIGGTVGLVDLLPTLADLLGVALPDGFRPSGTSFAAALRGAAASTSDSPQYAESLVPLLHFGWSDLRVLRRGSWKYVLAPRPELYDLASDPREQHNLAAEQPARAASFRRTLATILEHERQAGARSAAKTVPVDLLQRLGALGYVSGDPATSASSGADPKDKILEFRQANQAMRDGIVALNRHDYRSAAREFEGLIGKGITSFELHLYLARSLAGLKQFDRAASNFEEAVRRAPLLEEAWTGWAEARLATQGPEAARAIVRKGREQIPNGASLLLLEARVAVRLRRPDEAVTAYKAVLPLLPRDGTIRQELGELQRDLGQIDAALATLREAVAVEPANAGAWNALGMTLGGNGRLDEAAEAFRSAIARDASNHRYQFNLGLALARLGRSRDARPHFEKALQLAPDFSPAREELRKLPPDRGGL